MRAVEGLMVLGRGDRAPDFKVPSADAEGTVALADYLERGPIVLSLLRGLYCPFCRRHIGLLRPACESLRSSGITLVGVVIASPERARQYFRYFPPCFPTGAAPDRTIHAAYGLGEAVRTLEFREDIERRAAEILREMGRVVPAGQAAATFATDGFDFTPEDDAEYQRPLQVVGHFLVGRDAIIRWSRAESVIAPLPGADELLSLL